MSQSASTESTPDEIPTYLTPAILTTLICFMPIGLRSLWFATRVLEKLEKGEIEAARAASVKARKWAWIAFWVGVVWKILLISTLTALTIWFLWNYTDPGGF